MAEYRDIYLLISEQLGKSLKINWDWNALLLKFIFIPQLIFVLFTDEFDIYEVYDRIENDINKLTENYNVEHADALVELVCKVIPNIFSKQVNA